MNPEGQEVPRGEVGEIWLRSPSTAKEYWRLPEVSFPFHTNGDRSSSCQIKLFWQATKASFTPEGWFKTGDLG